MPVFLGAYRPHGVVFCFTTAAFELNEQHALTIEESIPEVFFANTSVDHRKIVADLHGDRPTEAAITRVYGEHLKQMLQSPATRWFNIPKDFATCTSFCCVSALDSLFQDPFRKFTHGLFMNKFLHWIIAAQQRQCCQALEQISAASGTFFNNLAVLCSTGDLETKRDVATERIEAAQVIILARITECTKALPELLEQKVREFKDEFLKKAISLPLEYNPRSITSKTEQAQSEITKKLGAWLTVKVVHPVITEMRKKIQDDVKTECQKIMEIEDNDVRKLLLGAAPTYNHKMHRLAQGGAVGLTGLGFVACLAAVAAVPLTGGASAALAVALGLSMCSLLGITGAGVLSAMDGLANADFNKIVAQHMLDSLCDRTKVEKQRQELEEVCRERTTQYFQSYLDKVTVLCKQREKMKNIFGAGNTADVQDLRLLFGKLNAEALEKRCEILQERTVQTSASSWSSTETSTPACIAVPLCPNNSSSHVTPVDTGIPATTTTTTSSSSSVTTVANDHDSFLAWKTDALANDTSTSGEPIMTTPAVAETTTSTPASSTTVTTTSTTTTATTADLLPLEHSMNNNQTGTVKVDLRKRSKEYQSAFFENLYYWSQMAQCSTHVLKLQTVFRENPKVWCMVHPQFHFTLKTYLEKHISTMELSEALVIAKDIITTIMDLHLHGTVFSNLKLENVVVTTEGDKVITELVTFHADTGSKGRDISDDGNSCTSIRGINVNPLSCSPKVDIFAFGVILSELTPKPTLLRCHITATGIVMATAPNTKPQLVNLINQCVTTKLNQRPAAWQVLESLNKILCMLENRSAGQNLGTGNSN
ncbi:hypothetical protein Pelo_18287 [Pelomyxa schiedti]|nr:hypothetical protein Pelo_18287 [Pelomyxa schiedti]